MANYQFTSDLLADVLFRASERTDGTSDFADQALIYLNRAYRIIWMGGAELDPTIQEDWYWLRADPPGILTLNPVINTGTVSVTNNSTAITFSSAPTPTVAGRFFRVSDHADLFRVSTHTAGQAPATLDGVYTGPTGSAKAYKVFQLEYGLASDLLRIESPIRAYRATIDLDNYKVNGMDLDELEMRWPLALVESGTPDAFAMITETKVRFNRYGGTTGTELIRLEYDYLKRPAMLTNAVNEEPVVPWQWRHILADAALFLLHMDKSDSRADAAGLMAKSGLKAMAAENHFKLTSIGRSTGAIYPRPQSRYRRPLRTESGLILG